MDSDGQSSKSPETKSAMREREILSQAQRLTSRCDKGKLAWYCWDSRPPARVSEPGNPLLLIPGGFGSWRHWIRNVMPLSQSRPVYCVELPGLGESDRSDRPHTASDIADVVVEGLAELFGRVRQFDLAGFSFGGIIGGQIALKRADQVRSLTIVGSNGLGLTLGHPKLLKQSADMSPDQRAASHRINLNRLMIADPQRVDALAVHVQIETTRRARTRSGEIPLGASLAEALKVVSVPVHGIWGSKDALVGDCLHERTELIEGLAAPSRFSVIEGAGHWVPYEQPERFNQVLLEGIAWSRTVRRGLSAD